MTRQGSTHYKTTLAVGLASLLALSACAGGTPSSSKPESAAGSQQLSGPLVVHSRGGTVGEAERKLIWDPFSREAGVQVVQQEIVDVAPAVKTQVETNSVEYDAVLITQAGYGLLSECCLTAIDYTKLTGDAAEVVKTMPDGAVLDYAVPTTTIGFNMAWSTEKFPKSGPQPETWADFWDVEKFPGQRAIYGNPFYLFEVALLADGVPGDKLYPLDTERALRKIEQLKPHVVQLWTQGAQGPQLLTTGEADLVMSYNGRLEAAIAEGAPIAYSWNGALTYHDYMAIPKGAPHPEAALAALNYMLKPDVAASIGEVTNFPVPSPLVWEAADPTARANWPNSPELASQLVQYKGGWWSEPAADGSGRTNQEAMTEKMNILFGR